MVIDAAQYSPGALSRFTYIFLILGNAARCAPLKIPQIASEDDIDIGGLFFHDVLSSAITHPEASTAPSCKWEFFVDGMQIHFQIFLS